MNGAGAKAIQEPSKKPNTAAPEPQTTPPSTGLQPASDLAALQGGAGNAALAAAAANGSLVPSPQLVPVQSTYGNAAAGQAANSVEDFVADQAKGVLRRVSPGLANLIEEGPINFAKRKVGEALETHLPEALGGFSLNELTDSVVTWLSSAILLIQGLLKGDAKSCKAFSNTLQGLMDFVTGLIDNPVIGFFKDVFSKVAGFVGKALKLVLAPTFDAISSVVSGAWKTIKAVASTISGWIRTAKEAIGAAWGWLMGKLGFSDSSEDGVWSWIKRIASEAWEGIKTTFAPVVEPIKKVTSVLYLLTPMGQVQAIVQYGPKVVQVVQWIWENGLSEEKIRQAPAEIQGMLHGLSGGVNGFKGTLKSGFDWLTSQLALLGQAFLEVAGAVTGLPLLGFAQSVFADAQQAAEALVISIQLSVKDAVIAIEGIVQKISDFVSPYKEILSSLILAIASPPLIPVILAGWAWRALPCCVKTPILNFVLDIAIAALEALPEAPVFGILWPLIKPAVMSFLGTLRAADDTVKEKVSDKVAKVISGASPEFLIGFVKGFAVGVWEGLTDPFKAIWSVLEGLNAVTEYLESLAGFGGETVTARVIQAPGFITSVDAMPSGPHAPESPLPAAFATNPAQSSSSSLANQPNEVLASAAEQGYVPVDPKAALQSGAPIPAATRRLLERLAAQRASQAAEAKTQTAPEPGTSGEAAPTTAVPPDEIPKLKERASSMAGELSPDIETVKGGFWDAVQEYFSGGKTNSFDDLIDKLSGAWESAKAKISEGGAWLADKLMEFFHGNAAEAELGDKVGWLTGTISFQVLLDFITAGTWAGAGPVLKGIAKFINWPMEVMGEAFKLLSKLGKYVLDGIKSLGGAIKEAASGAFKTVAKALGNIGERLIAFGEEIIGKFGGKAAKVESKAGGLLGREGARLGETEAANAAKREAAKLAEQKTAQKAEQKVAQKTEQQGAKKQAENTTTKEAEQKAAEEEKRIKELEAKAKNEGENSATKEGKDSAEKAAKKEAELPVAIAEAKTIIRADDLVNVPIVGLIAELMALKAQFGWIETFEAKPLGIGRYDIHMRASDHDLGSYDNNSGEIKLLQDKIDKRMRHLEDSEEFEKFLINTNRDPEVLVKIEQLAAHNPEEAEKLLLALENDFRRVHGSELPGLSSLENDAAKATDKEIVQGDRLGEKSDMPLAMREGSQVEDAFIAQQGWQKNTDLFRPNLAETNTSTFKAIVGEPEYTEGGRIAGTIVDSVTSLGHIEIKSGESVLVSTYQLRLQVYEAVTRGVPYTIYTSRPIESSFRSFLNFWGVNIMKL